MSPAWDVPEVGLPQRRKAGAKQPGKAHKAALLPPAALLLLIRLPAAFTRSQRHRVGALRGWEGMGGGCTPSCKPIVVLVAAGICLLCPHRVLGQLCPCCAPAAALEVAADAMVFVTRDAVVTALVPGKGNENFMRCKWMGSAWKCWVPPPRALLSAPAGLGEQMGIRAARCSEPGFCRRCCCGA